MPNLRDDDKFYIPFARTNQIAIQPCVLIPKLWVEFTMENIKPTRNKLIFNKELKMYVLYQLSEIPL